KPRPSTKPSLASLGMTESPAEMMGDGLTLARAGPSITSILHSQAACFCSATNPGRILARIGVTIPPSGFPSPRPITCPADFLHFDTPASSSGLSVSSVRCILSNGGERRGLSPPSCRLIPVRRDKPGGSLKEGFREVSERTRNMRICLFEDQGSSLLEPLS